MKIQKTFKYAVKPTKEQKEKFFKFSGCTRFVFNNGLSLIKKALDEKIKVPTYTDLANQLPKMKRVDQTVWLKEIHSQVLQQSLKDLESAMNHFWCRIKKKKGLAGFPRFKKKGIHDSFRYPQGIKLTDTHIFLPKIGYVRYKNSRAIEGEIKQVTVIRECDRWFVSIQCEFEKDVKKIMASAQKVVGIDLGLKYFAYTSAGEIVENPRWLKSGLKQLQKAQRLLSRKKRGSNNRKKMVTRVAKMHARIKNKRKDFLHKQSAVIVKKHDAVAVENLNISGMIKARSLARSIADVGWKRFLEFVKYKCMWAGKHYVEIDRFEPTSKKCSNCGSKQNMPLKVRIYDCDFCGMQLDRDLNASINIRAAGISVLKACGGIDISLPYEAGISGF